MSKELIDFFLQNTSFKEEDISNENLRLEEDLYMYGEDAEFFLIRYSNVLNVDISNLDFYKYFSWEVPFYFYSLYRRFSKRYKQKESLTIGDLERGIIYGRLDDEIIAMRSKLLE